MPFSLTGAPSSFQRLMDSVFHGLPFVTTYVYWWCTDSLLIRDTTHRTLTNSFSASFGSRTYSAGKKMPNWNNTSKLLRTCIYRSRYAARFQKVSSVQEWPTPTDLTTLQQFIGLVSYYRRYIKNFAEIVSPLQNLTQKDAPFVRTEPCATAFTTLKSKLTQAIVGEF